MSKQEFLQRLKEALMGEVPSGVIEENIRYYDDYISTEARNNSSEEAVILSIGDPRLIAKTIIDANENVKETESRGSAQTFYEDQAGQRSHSHFIDLSKWYWKLLAVVVVVLFFFLISSIVTGIFSLLMPLMGPLLLIFLLSWIIRQVKR